MKLQAREEGKHHSMKRFTHVGKLEGPAGRQEKKLDKYNGSKGIKLFFVCLLKNTCGSSCRSQGRATCG